MTDVLAEMDAARGVESDRHWAETAMVQLVLAGAPLDLVDAAIGTVAGVVRDSGESPQELYGDARQWALSQRAEWVEAGMDLDGGSGGVAGWLWATLACAVLVAVPFTIWLFLSNGWTTRFTLGDLILPVLLSGLVIGTLTVYETLLAHHPRPRALALTAVALAVIAFVGAAALMAAADVPVGERSTFWGLGIPAGYALLAWGALALPARPTSRRTVDDERWGAQSTRTLRSAGVDEEVVRRVVGEARSHAAASGQPLATEFGAPTTYAARFAPAPRELPRDGLQSVLSVLFWLCFTGWLVLMATDRNDQLASWLCVGGMLAVIAANLRRARP